MHFWRIHRRPYCGISVLKGGSEGRGLTKAYNDRTRRMALNKERRGLD